MSKRLLVITLVTSFN